MNFEEFLQSEFDVGELCRNIFMVYSCEFEQQDDKSVTITQSQKLKEMEEKSGKIAGFR